MELQGKKKKTRDFLSLYSTDSPFQLQDSSPSPQGFLLKTHDFLHPLETAEEEKATRGTTERTTPSLVHVLPGGIGTYTISHVSTTVKPEAGTCDAPTVLDPARKPDPASYAFALWDAASASAKDTGGQQWPSPFAAARSPPSFGSFPSCRSSQFQDSKRFMESASRFSKGFEDDDDDDDEFGKREGSSHKELSVRVDGKSGEQKANTPRSKHSATEQRRRSKINDRFQILRGLLPNSDQKRDKASFLLEVIEYIQFLQEKVHKYESMYPGWSDETTKLMPWVKVYFRSFWKNSRNHHHGSGDGLADPQVSKNGVASALLVPDNGIPVTPSILPSAQNPTESDLIAGISYKVMENPSGFANKVADAPASLQSNLYPSVGRAAGISQPQQRLITEADNMASQSEWLRSSFSADCTVSNDVLSEQEELTIDAGTISVSTAYSQGLLNTLSQALQNSGIDLSQANISVHINLGRRTSGSRQNASTSMATPKDQDEPLSSNLAMRPAARAGSRIDESEQASKRHKSSDHR